MKKTYGVLLGLNLALQSGNVYARPPEEIALRIAEIHAKVREMSKVLCMRDSIAKPTKKHLASEALTRAEQDAINKAEQERRELIIEVAQLREELREAYLNRANTVGSDPNSIPENTILRIRKLVDSIDETLLEYPF